MPPSDLGRYLDTRSHTQIRTLGPASSGCQLLLLRSWTGLQGRKGLTHTVHGISQAAQEEILPGPVCGSTEHNSSSQLTVAQPPEPPPPGLHPSLSPPALLYT